MKVAWRLCAEEGWEKYEESTEKVEGRGERAEEKDQGMSHSSYFRVVGRS